jgi:hypothetical protein
LSDEGWVYGDSVGAALVPWGGDLSTATWESAGGWIVYGFATHQQPPSWPLSYTNTPAKATDELLQLVAQMNLNLVGVNDRGQAVANTKSGQAFAFYFDPVETVPLPSTVWLVAAGLLAVTIIRARTARSGTVS